MNSPLFFVAEIDATKTGVVGVTEDQPPTARPHGTLARFAAPIQQTATFLFSDVGYRSRPTDALGIQVYPPLLQQGFSVDRRVNLDPAASSVGASWGTIEISNYDGQFDSIVRTWNSDGRGFRVLWGQKELEDWPGYRSGRTTTGTYIAADGTMQIAAPGETRVDFSGADFVTNAIRNGDATGAVAGTPGTAPTFWSTGNPAGVSSQIVGSGVEGGVSYVDVRFSGTLSAQGGCLVIPETGQAIAALPGQTWTASMFWRVVAGSLDRMLSSNIVIEDRNATVVVATGTTQAVLPTTAAALSDCRASGTRTLANPGTVYSRPYLSVIFSAGDVDFTVRVGGFQFERSATLGPYVATNGAARTAAVSPGVTLDEPAATNLVSGGGNAPSLGAGTGTVAASTGVPDIYAPATIYKHTRGTSGDTNTGTNNIPLASLAANTVYTGSFWIWIPSTTTATGVGLSLETGGVTLVSAHQPNFALKNQWQRCSYTSRTPVSLTGGTVMVLRMTAPSGGIVYTSCWQFEIGSAPTSFIPTTRDADRIYAARGIFLDPSRADLTNAYNGVATPWSLSDTTLSVPLRDASYWIERPYQTNQYLGTGSYEGTASLAGTLKPRTRGGTTAMPVCNVTPLLIDPVTRIYQYTDGPGTVVNLYEGGALTIARSTDTTNLYSGSTAAGQYRTDNSRGLFQLGSAPQQAITADVTGAFPIAGAVTTAASIARYMLTEDMLLPTAYLDTTSFTAANAAFPYTAGVYFDAGSVIDGAAALDRVLVSFGAKLVPTRAGTLSLFMLRALPTGAVAKIALSPENVVSVAHVGLPSTLDPPPFRWRVAYQHNHTVQTSGVLASATDVHRQFISIADRYSVASSTTILSNYRRPNDPDPIGGALLSATDAQAVANDFSALWTAGSNLFSVVVPATVGIALEIGDVASLTYPSGLLRSGVLGQIVGEQFRAVDATITLQFLAVAN